MSKTRNRPEQEPVPPLWVRDGTIALAMICGAKVREIDDVLDQIKSIEEPALPSEVIELFQDAIATVRARRLRFNMKEVELP